MCHPVQCYFALIWKSYTLTLVSSGACMDPLCALFPLDLLPPAVNECEVALDGVVGLPVLLDAPLDRSYPVALMGHTFELEAEVVLGSLGRLLRERV